MTIKKSSSNIRDVALLAGVSPGSVSKVLNASSVCRVSPELQLRIFDAAKKLEYTPNINAKRLFSKRTGIVALVVPPPSAGAGSAFEDRHLCRILGGIEHELFQQGYRLMFISNRKEIESSRELLELYSSKYMDGLIVWGAKGNEAYWEEVVARGIPLVFVSSIPENLDGKANFISSDYRNAARIVTRKVLAAGHRKIMFLGGQSAEFVMREIFRGMQDTLAEFGLPPETISHRQKLSEGDFAAPFVREYMAAAERASAIITLNYSSAVGVRSELANHGISCPRDVSMACFDAASEEKDNSLVRCVPDDWHLGVRAVSTLLSTVQKYDRPAATELLSVTEAGGESIATHVMKGVL